MKCCRSLSIPGTGVSTACVELLLSCSDINITINSIVHKNYDPELSASFTNLVTLPSSRHRRSYGDCLEDERENYQNCSVLYCVRQL